MYNKELANHERLFKDSADELRVETSLTVYEVYVETRRDKEGNLFLNKDGSERLFAIPDSDFTRLEADVVVKKIRDDYYKLVYQVNGDYVEKVERDGKRIYYVVDPEKVVTLAAGTQVVLGRNDGYKIPQEIGYVLIDDTDLDNQRVLAVRKFKTDDHKAEAEDIVNNSKYVHRD